MVHSAPSALQRLIIELPVDTPAVLVKAGPGSGKTRVLCDRILFLLANGIENRNITAVTFTQLAAAELRHRIEARAQVDVWTGTFHGYAYRILHAHGTNWGFPKPIRVLDENTQLHEIRNAFTAVTGYQCDEFMARDLARTFSVRKRKGQEIAESSYTEFGSPYEEDRIREIDEYYHAWLLKEHAFDYDELIYQVNRHLPGDEAALKTVRQEARFLLIDEFQDVSNDQFKLIETVAPVGFDDRSIFAVGDERQSIYRFRGAISNKLFTRFRVTYRAPELGLNENFRSTEAIVAVANLVQPPIDNTTLISVSDQPSRPIHVYGFQTVADEAERLTAIIQQRLDQGDAPESIGILYSTHRRADAIEQALSRAGVKVHRHAPNSIHDFPEAEPLIALMRDSIVPIQQEEVLKKIGLKPAGLVDEYDWIRWDRVRNNKEDLVPTLGVDLRLMTLSDCIKRSNPPKTPHGVSTFAQRLLKAYAPIVDVMGDIDWPILLEHLAVIDPFVTDAVLAVQAALDAGQDIILLTNDSDDARIARAMLQEVLPTPRGNARRFHLCLGCDVPDDVRAFRIEPVTIDDEVVSITTLAWRLAQQLLPQESFDGHSFVALDIETNSRYADRADIIELGAVRFDPVTGEVTDRFESFVQANKLTGDIATLTGITIQDLHTAPGVAEVLQRFFAWLRPDDILIGHNVADFDLTVLGRLSKQSGLGVLKQPSIDTLTVARRLLPHLSPKLEDLKDHLNLTPRRSHRALSDAETTAELFVHLMRVRDQQMRVRSLDGALPLVAASQLRYPQSGIGISACLIRLGTRRLRIGASGHFEARARNALGRQWNSLRLELLRRKHKPSQEEQAWSDFQDAWVELIERHHKLMPNLTATELAGSIALSANHSTGILPNHVTMMTIHTAKGKEWETVLMIGAEDDQFPARSNPEPEEVEEGGRLFYVGVTRARSRLLVSWAIERDGKIRRPSRHLGVIPRNEPDIAIVRNYFTSNTP